MASFRCSISRLIGDGALEVSSPSDPQLAENPFQATTSNLGSLKDRPVGVYLALHFRDIMSKGVLMSDAAIGISVSLKRYLIYVHLIKLDDSTHNVRGRHSEASDTGKAGLPACGRYEETHT